MSFNVAGGTQADTLTVFGSLVTEMPPENVPEGTSPDNQDVVYVPGGVGGRQAMAKQFATPLGVCSVTYAKSFIDPQGNVNNLVLDSLGNLWLEYNFGTPSVIGTVTPGSYARSVTAFGREYIAFSDGLHGTDIALQWDGTNLDRVTTDGPGIAPKIANTILPASTISGAGRGLSTVDNEVQITTSAAHGLQPGYLAQITGIGAVIVEAISTIVIDNESLPGIATVTTTLAHGLPSGAIVSIVGVPGSVVGTGISAINRKGQIVTVTTSSAHNLSVGATVTLAGVTDTSFNTTFTVTAVTSSSTFVVIQVGSDATSSGGTVTINWPLPDTASPYQFEVLAVPSTTTFQVAITYSDGTFSGGQVFQTWDGQFFVKSVPSPTTFTYFQLGPTVAIGVPGGSTVTPFGQAAPGVHQMQVAYLTRQGYITKPSPPLKFAANGGEYLTVSDIPIGPSNIVARILLFTGAGGASFFYIPTPAQVNGQVVSTATQINDNTTTSVVLDFSDNTLYSAIGVNIPGNNIPSQFAIDGACAFGFLDTRLVTWGQRNCILNLLNMSFDGGSCSRQAITGWTGTGSLVAGHFSVAVATPNLQQSFYQDAYGAPIATPNTLYAARCCASGPVTVTISSVSTLFSTTATVTPGPGGWGQATFGTKMPNVIPADMLLTVTSAAGVVDHLSIIYAANPYLDTVLFGSYVNNPEAFDALTGKFGPSEDTHKVMDMAILRGTPYLLTQDPAGRLHGVAQSGVTEPSGWTVTEIGANCGALSILCTTKSQADDFSGSGGEEWFMWASSTGARIFGGDQPWKISQEIQPDWQTINPAARSTVWAVNDPVARVCYFGLPMGAALAPTLIYPVDYRELDTAYQIANSPPIHTSFSGKLIATDHSRKWTRWNVQANGAALLCTALGQLSLVVFGGTGTMPGAAGFGNIYQFSKSGLADDDYGSFFPYYTTYFFVGHDQEQGLRLGFQRKILQYFQFFIEGQSGTHVQLTVFVNNLQNSWPFQGLRNLQPQQNFDMEWPGGSAVGQRFAFQFAVIAGTV